MGLLTERFLGWGCFNFVKNADFLLFLWDLGPGRCANDRRPLWHSDTRILSPNRAIWFVFDHLHVNVRCFCSVFGFPTLPPRGPMTTCECPKSAWNWFSEFIHPGYSTYGMKRYHLASAGSSCDMFVFSFYCFVFFLSFGTETFP